MRTTYAVSALLIVGALASAAQEPRPAQRGRNAQDRPATPNLDAPRPIDARDSVWIEELTWMEVRDAVRGGKTTAIVATGGMEQNGPYVATGKHNFVLQATAEAIARRLGNALIAPIVKFVPEGRIEPPSGHMQYAGTISLREDTFVGLLTDIASSLKQHGFREIVLIGDSGGNSNGMQKATDLLNAQWKNSGVRVHHIREYYESDMWSFDYLKEIGIKQMPDVKSASRAGIHDDYHYESIIMTIDPTHVRVKERQAKGLFSINGVDMNPPEKAIENGKKLVEYRARITVDAIRKAIGED